jgi:hypothetical protein
MALGSSSITARKISRGWPRILCRRVAWCKKKLSSFWRSCSSARRTDCRTCPGRARRHAFRLAHAGGYIQRVFPISAHRWQIPMLLSASRVAGTAVRLTLCASHGQARAFNGSPRPSRLRTSARGARSVPGLAATHLAARDDAVLDRRHAPAAVEHERAHVGKEPRPARVACSAVSALEASPPIAAADCRTRLVERGVGARGVARP